MSAKTNQTKAQTFDTAIIVESDNWRVKVYLGLAGLVVLTVLAFVYRLEAGIIALAVGLAGAGRVALVGYHRHKLAGYERRRLEAETAKAEAEAVRAKAQAYFVETNSGVFQLAGIVVERFYPAVSASKLLADLPAPPPLALPEPARLRRLLDVKFIHILIVGPTDIGKTTVENWLIDNEPYDTSSYVLDPHNKFNKWSGRAKILTTGRDYRAIDKELVNFIEVMDERYNSNQTNFPKIQIVCDEWLSIRDNCPHAKEFFNTIGSEARKVNMSLILSTVSATVEDLDCTAATRDNLVQLNLNRSLKEKNQGQLKWSRGDIELVELPGPYRPVAPLMAAPPVAPPAPPEFEPVGWDAGPVAPLPPETELQIVQLYNQGKSLRAISREVFGSVGGRQVTEIKATLEKMGVSGSVSGGVSDDVSKPENVS